jgi:long-chain acyl-CoA synthetase
MAEIVSGERRIDSEELQLRAARAASALKSLGVGQGSGVALCLRNDIEFFEVSLGAGALGAFAIPINWHCSPDEVRYILEDSGAKVLVIHADLLARARASLPDDVAVVVVRTSPAVRQAYGIDEAAATPAGDLEWSEWITAFEPHAAPAREMTQAIIYTSGTTGRPKGVRRPPFTPDQQAAVVRMLAIDFGLAYFDDPGDIVTAVIGPIYHSAPNAHAIFSLRAGANVVFMPRFDPEDLLRLIERERITHLNMVPIMFSRLLKLPEEIRLRYDVSSLRFVAHAAAPCPPDVKRAMIDWWGPVINEYYGATECGNVTFCTAEEWLSHPGTVGRPIEGVELRILDDSGSALPPGEIGEIAAAYVGLHEFTYHGDEEKRRSIDRDGLIAPGDVGYVDEEGYLFICDRKVDMVISGGVNIYPAEIESVLHEMPEIADCAVFGIPDDDYGESLCAVIEPRLGQELAPETVQAFLRDRVAGYKVPRRVEFREALPREDSGKIFKRKLREPFWEGAGRTI